MATTDLDAALALAWRPRTAELLLATLGLAAAVCAAAAMIGTGLAWLVEMTRFPGRRLLATVAPLPLAVPSYVAAYTWMSHSPQLAGFTGAWLVLTASTYPYVYLTVTGALRRLDPALLEVSRSLGRGARGTFWSVVLPQIRPAIAAGTLLVALYTLSDFGAVSILRYRTFTSVIYTSLNGFDRTPAIVLSAILVLVTAVVVLAEVRSRGRAGYARVGSGAHRPHRRLELGRLAPLAWFACAAVLTVAVLVPVASMIRWIVIGRSRELDLPALLAAAGTSVTFAGLGALATVVLAIGVGLLAARHRDGVGRWLETTTYLGHAVPAVVIGLSLVVLSLRLTPALYQTTVWVVVAYVVLFLPIAVGAVRAAAVQNPPVLGDVARSLGRSPRQVLTSITLPIAAPGVLTGALLVFLTGMKELTATLMLHPTGMESLAMRLWSEAFTRSYAAAAPYALTLLLVSAVPAYLLSRRSRETELIG